MAPQPLSITSPAHPASIAAYAAFTFVGWTFLNTGNSRWFQDSIGNGWASFLMTVMLISGVASILAAFFAAFSRDPSTGLTTEILALIPLVLSAGVLAGVAIATYGLNITVVLLSCLIFGSLGRLIQAGVERYNLYRAKQAAKLITQTSLADPKG